MRLGLSYRKTIVLVTLGVLLVPKGIFAYPYSNPAVDYSTGAGTQPYGLVAVDLNGDNFLDFATANLSTSTVSVLINDGDGTFATAVQYSVGTAPRAIVAADFNDDGELDLATANATSSNVSILMGNGDGTFDAAVHFAVDASRWAIGAGDLDNDGDIDIAAAGSDASGTVSVILNNGSGSFATQTSYAAGSSARGVFFGLFDNDLFLDMAVPNQGSSTVSVFINDGDGTFGSAVNYNTGTNTGPRGIGGEDFNNDGEIDLVTANFTTGTVSYLQGNGDGTFDSAVQYSADTNSLAVLVADLDGDGEKDLAVANYNANNASVLISNGDGTFDAAVDYAAGTNPRSMIVGQLDNADNIDFAVANGGSHNISVYLSSGAPILPVIDSISSNTANGTYTVGQVIDIDVTFSKNVTSTGGVLVTLETGATDRTCSFTIFNSAVGSCNYTVQAGDATSDLTVASLSGSIVDGSGGTLVNFVPTTNLAVNKNIVIETTNPTIQTLSPVDNATSVSASANLVITFDEAVDVGTGNVSIYKASDDSLLEAIDVTSALLTGTGTSIITINPSSTLTEGVEYYVLVAATAFDDLAGNSFAGIASTTAWSFTVESISSSSSSSSSSSHSNIHSGGGGGHRGATGPGGGTSAERAKQARLAIAERFNVQMKNSSTLSGEQIATPPAMADKPDQDVLVVHKAASNLRRIAQQRGKLHATVEDREVLYRDVAIDQWYTPYVASLIENGVAHGYRDEEGKPTGEFGVVNPVTRAEILKMAIEASGKKLLSRPPRNFSAQGTWAAPYVGEAEQLGISVFRIDADVNEFATRGEVMQILLEVIGLPVGKEEAEFIDVPADHPFNKAISTAAFYGLVEGDTDANGKALHTFRPDEQINRAEVAKIIALLREIIK